MRSLTLSLLIVVVVSIFGLGWALDALFARYSEPGGDELSVVISMGQDTATALDGMAVPEDFVDHADSVVATDLTHADDFPVPGPLMSQLLAGEPIVLESDQGLSVHYYLPSHNQVYSLENVPVGSTDSSWMKVLFTSAFYLGTLALVLVWLKPLLQRLGVLRRAAVEFGDGDLNSRVEMSGISYIADIEHEYNRMADRIQTLVEDNKLLTSAVSHDLRTPLSRLRFGIDTLEVTDNKQAQAKYLGRISRDLDEMESLINSLLRYARMDNVMDGVNKETVSLSALCQECTSQFLDEDISISVVDDSSHNNVFGSVEHLASLINNLLQNAVIHAETQVLLRIFSSDNAVSLAVCDDGPGLQSVDGQQIMKPFQRGDDSAGYGMGLAIVSRVAAHHRAQIEAGRCEKLGGAEFTVRFPAA